MLTRENDDSQYEDEFDSELVGEDEFDEDAVNRFRVHLHKVELNDFNFHAIEEKPLHDSHFDDTAPHEQAVQAVVPGKDLEGAGAKTSDLEAAGVDGEPQSAKKFSAMRIASPNSVSLNSQIYSALVKETAPSVGENKPSPSNLKEIQNTSQVKNESEAKEVLPQQTRIEDQAIIKTPEPELKQTNQEGKLENNIRFDIKNEATPGKSLELPDKEPQEVNKVIEPNVAVAEPQENEKELRSEKESSEVNNKQESNLPFEKKNESSEETKSTNLDFSNDNEEEAKQINNRILSESKKEKVKEKAQEEAKDQNAEKSQSKDHNSDDKADLKEFDFQPVDYVRSLTPVSIANLKHDKTPEYEQLISDGYETPRVYRPIVREHSTPVQIGRKKHYKLMAPPRDKEMWENVKAIKPGKYYGYKKHKIE